jgi:hypothetical protein
MYMRGMSQIILYLSLNNKILIKLFDIFNL